MGITNGKFGQFGECFWKKTVFVFALKNPSKLQICLKVKTNAAAYG
jgi:hypothetical protein